MNSSKKKMNLSNFIGIFDSTYYNKLSVKNSKKYKKKKPFPHIQFNNFLPKSIANKLSDSFPKFESSCWIKFKKYGKNKNTYNRKSVQDERKFPLEFRSFFREVNSRQFILFLESLTGIDNLIPDPYFMGGGIHSAKKGGYINVHSDFNWHHKLQLHRRVNVLIYLTKNWKKNYGGHLEFWSKNKKMASYPPDFNSAVIFNTTNKSFHGVPEPLNTDKFRRVLNLYYYTSNRPKNEISEPHFTNYQLDKKFSKKIKKGILSVKNAPWSAQLIKDYRLNK